MNIWLIKASENLPIDEGQRLSRVGMLFQYLIGNGHTVTWWSSTFHHANKNFRFDKTTEISYYNKSRIILLHSSKGYKKNYSLNRIKYCNVIAEKFIEKASNEEKPDIILCAWPTQQLAKKAVGYGKKNDVPVIIDVRDLWPDSFATFFPDKLQPLATKLLLPMINDSNKTMSQADAITAVSEGFVDWGCKKANRSRNDFDRAIFIANEPIQFEANELEDEIKWWAERGVTKDTWNICLFSTLTIKNRDIHTNILAVKELSKIYPNIRFVIGGTGDDEEYFKKLAADSENIVFGGWLDNKQMNSLMLISKCGSYAVNNEMFSHGFGNKPIQYASAGLPILCAQDGFPKEYIEEQNMGIYYEAGNVNSCIKAIENLIKNEGQRLNMAKCAQECFDNNYEMNTVNKQFEEIMKKLVENRRG